MSLIACPECGNQISDKAEICPHCGVNLTEDVAEYDEEFYELVKDALDDLGWEYDNNESQGRFILPGFPSNSAIGNITLAISVAGNHLLVSGLYESFKCSNYLNKIYELFGRLNGNPGYPPLSVVDNGLIICSHYTFLDWEGLDSEYVKLISNGVLGQLQRCGNAIMMVANGIASPEQALNSIQDDD